MIQQLKFLFTDFKEFFKKDFNIKVYLYTTLFIAFSIAIVYGTEIGKLIPRATIPTDNKLVNNMFWFLLMYFSVIIPILLIRKEYQTLKKVSFWIKTSLFVALIGFSDIFSWSEYLNFGNIEPIERSFISKTLWRATNLLFIFPILVIYKLFFDKGVNGLYGVSRGNHHVKAYLSLYVVILPILLFISFTPDFRAFYPSYKPWAFENVFNIPIWLSTSIYEIVYMSDFFMVELIFRGALVIGLASLLGRNAVLPMVGIYVMLHFGKPVMENLSAIFGGYFLGALAFQSRHIWGGIIIHMGIALIIELLRFFQYYILGIG